MSKYQYTNSNITFDNVKVDVKPLKMVSGKIQHSDADYAHGEVGTLYNAVEIDWNSAKLGQTTINTTGESRCSITVQGIAA